MEFFKTISEHMKDGQQLSLTIKKNGENLVVSILPDTSSVKDKSVSNLTPLVMNGTPDDFENGFAEALAPVDKAIGLISDVKAYENEVEQARSKSEMESKKKAETDKLKKKYNDLLSLAKKNINAKKFKDARSVLEKASELSCSDKKDIDNVLADIESKSGSNSLFGAAEDLSDGKDIEIANSESQEERVEDDDNENEEE
ncbi:PRTRC system protein E [Prevotella melaninogenica]|jgi:PRTRC system protein E|uniref:PRTRC system protein E n=1 Tax=Prevotella melaninogenica TaxID=28132 RepID=UPI001C5E6D81|nr:PRTRC system protein E [Prevotella melaninogenica]MBW4733874.1 PRTRC system protein E [Prevotella melaninogenica]MBW4736258.1 PRTRC system protein E [Prevotella melaninogenica]MBW4879079.1 PRTRC system protein E [Prevotella melaninogenica]